MSLFTYGFNEDKVCGFLAAYFGDTKSGWFEYVNELKMLYAVKTGLGGNFNLTEPEPRSITVADVRNAGQTLNGTQLRELMREVFEKMNG